MRGGHTEVADDFRTASISVSQSGGFTTFIFKTRFCPSPFRSRPDDGETSEAAKVNFPGISQTNVCPNMERG